MSKVGKKESQRKKTRRSEIKVEFGNLTLLSVNVYGLLALLSENVKVKTYCLYSFSLRKA